MIVSNTTAPSRPIALAVDFAGIPAELMAGTRFVVWKYTLKDGDWTKPPRQTSGALAATDAPATWTTFAEAKAAYENGGFDGIGIVLTADDELCAGDLDHCVNTDGELEQWAEDIVADSDTYSERSPGGGGLRFFRKGKWPIPGDKTVRKAGNIEAFNRTKFCTLTGRKLDGTPQAINGSPESNAQLYNRMFPTPPQAKAAETRPAPGYSPYNPDDEELLSVARCARNGVAFRELFDRGNTSPYNGDASAADLALVSMLAFYAGADPAWIDRLFQRSALAREKWTDREDYRAMTIGKALEGKTEFFDWQKRHQREQAVAEAVKSTFPPIPPESIRPAPISAAMLVQDNPEMREAVVHGVVRRGEVGNLISAPKMFKTYTLLDLALAVVMGWQWLGFQCIRGRVLILDFELHKETMAHRLPAVMRGRGMKLADLDDRLDIEIFRGRRGVNIDTLRGYFESLGPDKYDLIIIDPAYKAYPAEFDENSNADMAGFYTTLDNYAATTNAALMVCHHSSKGSQSEKAVTDLGAGAGTQSRAADAHLSLRPHEEDNCAVFAGVVRSWAPFEPVALRWTYPLWSPDPSLDPTQLRKASPRLSRRAEEGAAAEPDAPALTPEQFADTFTGADPRPQTAVLAAAEAAGMTGRGALRLLTSAESTGLIGRQKVPGDKRTHFARIQK